MKHLIAMTCGTLALCAAVQIAVAGPAQSMGQSSIITMAQSGASAVDACVASRISEYRRELGPDSVIRMDVLGEWEGECRQAAGMPAADSALQVEQCVSGRIDAARAELGEDYIIRWDVLEEWEQECRAGR